MKRIYIGTQNNHQFSKSIKKKLRNEIKNVNLVYSNMIHKQKYNRLKKVIYYIAKLIMVILIISTLFLIIQQNQEWYVK